MSDKHHLFAGHNYYPAGGMDDLFHTGTLESCMDSFSSKREEIAHRHGGGYTDNWCQIVRASDMKVVMRGEVRDNRPVVWRQEQA